MSPDQQFPLLFRNRGRLKQMKLPVQLVNDIAVVLLALLNIPLLGLVFIGSRRRRPHGIFGTMCGVNALLFLLFFVTADFWLSYATLVSALVLWAYWMKGSRPKTNPIP